MGRLARLHASRDQVLVRAVDVVGAEADVPEVDLSVVGAAELELEPVAGSASTAKSGVRLSTTMPNVVVRRST